MASETPLSLPKATSQWPLLAMVDSRNRFRVRLPAHQTSPTPCMQDGAIGKEASQSVSGSAWMEKKRLSSMGDGETVRWFSGGVAAMLS